MKFYYFFLILLFIACNNNRQPATVTDTTKTTATDTAAQKRKQSLYAKDDTVTIISESGYDTLRYAKNDFNDIIDYFPELHEEIPDHPGIAYVKSGEFRDITDKDGNKKHISFGSEQGQDVYFILYAYFLKPRNDYAALQRNKLRKCYHIINRVFHTLNGFGTFFDHQFRRIQAYAAYDTYQYAPDTDNFFSADIKKEKKYFLETLKQEVSNSIKNNNDILPAAHKAEVISDLFREINQLDTLVTTQYMLHRICEFRYSYYQ